MTHTSPATPDPPRRRPQRGATRRRQRERRTKALETAMVKPVHERLMAALLAACVDVSLGTIWRVREDLWTELLVDYHSDREWHPGLSLLNGDPPVSVLGMVPMLHGSSGTHGPLVFKGLTRELGAEHPTSFGRRLAPVCLAELVRRAVDADPAVCTGPRLGERRVVANWDKLRLNDHERRQLIDWATRKGLL